MAKTTAVGLDLAATHVRAAVVEYDSARNDVHPKVKDFAQVPLDPVAMAEGEVANAPLVSAAVRHLFKANHLPVKNVVLGLGGTHVTVREVELPRAPMDQLRAGLQYVVRDELSVKVEDSVLDFSPVWVEGSKVRGLLVAAGAEAVNRSVEAVADAGVDLAKVDLAAFALARAFARGPYAKGVIGIVDMGASATDVVVVADAVPQMARTLPYGGELVTESVMRACSVPHGQAERMKQTLGLAAPPADSEAAKAASAQIVRRAQAVAEAIGQTFAFHAQRTGQQVGGVLVTGRAALLEGFDRYLAQTLRLPMARGAIDQLADVVRPGASQIDDGLRSDMALATGLAYGGAP
jgi:type IV pilus assembly protein PilM